MDLKIKIWIKKLRYGLKIKIWIKKLRYGLFF